MMMEGLAAAPLLLPPTGMAPAEARAYVGRIMSSLGLDGPLRDAAVLAISEMTTNALLHARTEVTVAVRTMPGGALRIEVTDQSPLLPHPAAPSPGSTTGRGLQLLAALGTWGVDRLGTDRGGGKTVWLRLAGAGDVAEEAGPRHG